MRMRPIDVTLGAQTWRVRPLTVAQVQDIEPILDDVAQGRLGAVAAALRALAVALRRDHPEAIPGLCDVEAGADDIAEAMRRVLRLGGFMPVGDPAPGEGDAGRAPASTGPAPTPV